MSLALPPSDPPPIIRRVAFQGELGAFSEEAVLRLWPHATPVPAITVSDVTEAVSQGLADAGVLPVENTVAGGVVAAYDALAAATDLHAISETVLPINQCLLALAGASIASIRIVDSHPVALAQCSRFLRGLVGVEQRAATDTAGAARDLAAAPDAGRAVIASRHAASRYGLAVLAEHVEDRPDNQTRFLGIARASMPVPAGVAARTSLLLTTPNAPGTLLRVLQPLAEHGLNISKLESRPTGEPWTYRFFIDVDHPAGDPRLTLALAALRPATHTCRILGTYPRAVA